MTTEEQILRLTLDQMPDEFSSDAFCTKARNHGLDNRFIRYGNVAVFLHKHCYQTTSKRRWVKAEAVVTKGNMELAGLPVGTYYYELPDITTKEEISEAIALLKHHGYKVMKQETEWKEV